MLTRKVAILGFVLVGHGLLKDKGPWRYKRMLLTCLGTLTRSNLLEDHRPCFPLALSENAQSKQLDMYWHHDCAHTHPLKKQKFLVYFSSDLNVQQ
jgi:hypothetical protein